MATKPAAAPATAPAAAPGGAQILQNLQTLNTKVDAIDVKLNRLEELFKLLTNLGAAVTSMEHKITTLDVSVKAVNAGTKRQPKAPTEGAAAPDGAAPTTAAASSPSGEKFASNTLTWLGNMFKADAAGVKAKYFSEAQLTSLTEQLTADAAYQKFDTDIAAAKTDKAKDDLRYKKAAAEFRKLWAIGKDDAALSKKLQDDWRDAKSKYEQNNRTPAKADA